MSSIFITGGTGFIGRAVLRQLAGRTGTDIYCLSRRYRNAEKGVRYLRGSLSEPESFSRYMHELRPELLLHLAWDVSEADFANSEQNCKWIEWSTLLVKEFLAAGGSRVVGGGTCFEYDTSLSRPIKEDDPCHPATLYGQCKFETCRRLSELCRNAGASFAWGRIFYPYGPGEEPRKFVTQALNAIQAGQVFHCKAPDNVADYIFVDDVAAMFVRLLERENCRGIYNLCTGRGMRIGDMLTLIAELSGKPYLADLSAGSEASYLVGDTSRQSEFGWTGCRSFRDGLKEYFSDTKMNNDN